MPWQNEYYANIETGGCFNCGNEELVFLESDGKMESKMTSRRQGAGQQRHLKNSPFFCVLQPITETKQNLLI